MSEDLNCPFCGGEVRIGVCDDEGNYPKPEGYENDPWSGLAFALIHDETDVPEGKQCPISTNEEDMRGLGRYLYDSREEAKQAWNTRNLTSISTSDLVKELETREGVDTFSAKEPTDEYEVHATDTVIDETKSMYGEGPCKILVVRE